MSAPLGIQLDAVEATLLELVEQVTPPPRGGRGRPTVLAAAWLWTAMLVCILRGDQSIRACWRLLSVQGLGTVGPINLSADAISKRLYRGSASVLASLFEATREIVAADATIIGEPSRYPHVIAIDGSTLDQVARRLPWLRGLPAGDAALLPGKLLAAFDVERQCFWEVQVSDLPRQNEKLTVRSLLSSIPPGSLILADLGFFSFAWFDTLTDQGYPYISRLRGKTSTIPVHILVDQPRVRDSLVSLGAYRADQAKHLVRLIEVEHRGTWHRFITNERDPATLSIEEVVTFYARRWDIEMACKLIKRDLGLHLLWSAKWEVLLAQVWGVLLIAQVVFHLRGEVARRAEVALCDVSLTLLVRELPRLLAAGVADPLGRIVERRDYGGFIRPSRRTTYAIPPLPPPIPPPPDLVTTREPRYAGRRCGPDGTNALHQ